MLSVLISHDRVIGIFASREAAIEWRDEFRPGEEMEPADFEWAMQRADTLGGVRGRILNAVVSRRLAAAERERAS